MQWSRWGSTKCRVKRLPSQVCALLALLDACTEGRQSAEVVAFAVREAAREDGTRFPLLLWVPTTGTPGDSLRLRDVVAAEGSSAIPDSARLAAFRARYAATFEDRPGTRAEEALAIALGVRGSPRRASSRRLPLVVVVGALNGAGYDHAALASHLARRGLAVVSVPSGAAAARQTLQIDAAGARAQLEDLRLALRDARRWPEIDSTRVALVAWSTGGLAAAVAANELGARTALVSLDAATGYQYGDTLLREIAGSGWRWSRPYLHLQAGVTGPVVRSERFFELGCGTRSWRASVAALQHRHFVSYHGAFAPALSEEIRSAVAAQESYVGAFLAHHLVDTNLALPAALVAVPLPSCPT